MGLRLYRMVASAFPCAMTGTFQVIQNALPDDVMTLKVEHDPDRDELLYLLFSEEWPDTDGVGPLEIIAPAVIRRVTDPKMMVEYAGEVC